MDDITFKQHYDRIKRQMENEKLLTFEELLDLTKLPPEVLKRTIKALAHRFCLYKKIKDEPEVDEDADDFWTLQDLQDILNEHVEHRETKSQVEQREQRYKEDKENHDQEDYGLGDTSSDENLEQDDEEFVSFEDLVRLTGCHPFYLERSLCQLALQAERE